MKNVVLITGANKGIGFEVARQLGQADFTVLLGARDASRGEEAADTLRAEGSDIAVLPCEGSRLQRFKGSPKHVHGGLGV